MDQVWVPCTWHASMTHPGVWAAMALPSSVSQGFSQGDVNGAHILPHLLLLPGFTFVCWARHLQMTWEALQTHPVSYASIISKCPEPMLWEMLPIHSHRPDGEPGVGCVRIIAFHLPPSATTWISGALELCGKCKTLALYTYVPSPRTHCLSAQQLDPKMHRVISGHGCEDNWGEHTWWDSDYSRSPRRVFIQGQEVACPFVLPCSGPVWARPRSPRGKVCVIFLSVAPCVVTCLLVPPTVYW